MDKLLGCPFCGSPAEVRSCRCGEDGTETWVECTGCGVSTDRVDAPYSEPLTARALWNTRHTQSLAGDDELLKLCDRSEHRANQLFINYKQTEDHFYRVASEEMEQLATALRERIRRG